MFLQDKAWFLWGASVIATIERGCMPLKGEKYGFPLQKNYTPLPCSLLYLCLCDLYLKQKKRKPFG